MSAKTIETVLAENSDLSAQVKTLTTDRDKARTDLTAITAERDQLKTSNKTVVDERDSARTSITSLTKERDDLKAANDKLAAESKDVDARAATLAKAWGIIPLAQQSPTEPTKAKTATEICRERNKIAA